MPKVSVICAVHNGERFLAQSIQSVLDQDFGDFECILVNDGSTDSTGEILARFAAGDRRIAVVEQNNQGLTRSLNSALDLATGEYVARHDDDDISLPQRLSRQVAFLDGSQEHAAVGCRYLCIDVSGSVTNHVRVPLGSFAIKRALLTHNVIAHSAAMYRRETVKDLGGYDTSFATAQDYDLWCRLALRSELANLRQPLVKRREHPGQVGRKSTAPQRANRDRIRQAYRLAILRGEMKAPAAQLSTLRALAKTHNQKDRLIDRVRPVYSPRWLDKL